MSDIEKAIITHRRVYESAGLSVPSYRITYAESEYLRSKYEKFGMVPKRSWCTKIANYFGFKKKFIKLEMYYGVDIEMLT